MSASISIRPATAQDQTAIRRAVLRNNLNPMGLNWQSFSVAVDEAGAFVGCGQIKQHLDIAELASLVVEDAWQGRGVADLLLKSLLAQAPRPLWLMCESPLVTYYEKYGFIEVKSDQQLPLSFRGVHWITRFPLGFLFFARGTYVAFMKLDSN